MGLSWNGLSLTCLIAVFVSNVKIVSLPLIPALAVFSKVLFLILFFLSRIPLHLPQHFKMSFAPYDRAMLDARFSLRYLSFLLQTGCLSRGPTDSKFKLTKANNTMLHCSPAVHALQQSNYFQPNAST